MKYFTLIKNIIFTLILSTFIFADPPSDWDSNGDGLFDNITNYQNSGSVTSRTYLNGSDIGSADDLMAAFVDGEQRGFVSASAVPAPLGGGYAFLLLVYSNQASGETITFQFYDAETDSVYDVDETYDFISDMVLGNVVTPEQFTLSVSIGDDGGNDCASGVYDCAGECDGTVVEDCAGICGGSAVVDECGVCDGSGIADGTCDCDGNIDLGCGCGEAGPSGCDNACGSTA
ncbi:MAG: hypothetical protein CMG50_01900, partial [Candidatus Marinimicrobia bacterium]|nr:hypothetical protein [Candidatus Neomarinimicrobiota bacterium]